MVQILKMRAAAPKVTIEGEGEENLLDFQIRGKITTGREEMDAGILVKEKKTMKTPILRLLMHQTEIKVDKTTGLQIIITEEAEEGAETSQTEEGIIQTEEQIVLIRTGQLRTLTINRCIWSPTSNTTTALGS